MDDKALAKYPGLYARDNGAWYVRKRVPVDLIGLEKRSQLRFSLETSDLRTAKKRYPFKLSEIELHFETLRNRLQKMSAMESAVVSGKLERLRTSEIEALVSDWWGKRESARQPAVEQSEELSGLLADVVDDSLQSGAETVQSVADALLVDAGVLAQFHRVGAITTRVRYPVVDRGTSNYRYLCELVARGLSIETDLAKDHLLSTDDAPNDRLFNADAKVTGSPAGNLRLVDLFETYIAERSALHGRQSTEKRYGFVFRIMDEVLGGSRLVSSLTRADCVQVLAFLKRLPPNASKRFPAMSLTEVVEKADAQGLPRLAPNSIASYMQALAAVVRWAAHAGWGINVNMRDLIGSREATVKRRGFRTDELELLFGTLATFRNIEPAKFWVPALALFTGARAGEICQLRIEDIVEVEGVYCLNLSLFDQSGRRVDGKRLKSKASERYVPLHPALLNAGFLAFVQSGEKGERLFPALKQGPDGRYSHDFSKWFGRHKKRAGFDEPALVFHSFRHGFRDACRRAEINEETAHALGGWASEGQAARYGDRGMVPVLNRAIQKLDFGRFNLPSAA
jgi:integrase